MVSALLFLATVQSWTPLVQIGRVDHNTADLAFGPAGYSKFSTDPVFVLGRSDSKRDWPYVIPGPGDAWANGRQHAFEIRFALASVPDGAALRVRSDFAETHPANPPRFRLTVNGQNVAEWDSPKGHGDEGLMGKPETGVASEWTVDVPASKLRPGTNTIELRSIAGSWAAFDAVTVEGRNLHASEPPAALEAHASAPGQTLLNTPSGPGRDVPIRLVNTGPATEAKLAIEGGTFAAANGTAMKAERSSVMSVTLPTGATDLRLECVTPAKGGALEFRLAAPNGLSAEDRLALRPVRPWRIFLLPEGHVDIGYTHPQNIVAEIQTQNIKDALKLAEETRDRPAGERYRWNVETAWGVEHYLAAGNAKDRERLKNGIASGELGVSVAYANMLYGLCRPEEMLRTFTVPSVPRASFDTVTLSDVPGVPWGLVTALHEAGVKNLVYWPNAGDTMQSRLENHPRWWIGRDGSSRVFFWPMTPYSLGADIKGVLHMGGTWYPGRPHAVKTNTPAEHFLGEWLPAKLDSIASWYPYDIVGVPWSISDNGAIDQDVPEAVRLWNERYASPKIEIVGIDDACRRFLREYGSKLATVSGDFGPQWEDGAASSSYETAINRAASARLAQAEIAWSLVSPSKFPRERFDKSWRDVLLYSEHTWGAADSWDNPEGPNQKLQWAVKSGFARNADKDSRALLSAATGVQPRTSREFTILNTSARPRTGLVEFDGVGKIVDDKGNPVQSQRLSNGKLAFVASDVTALGVRRYRYVAGSAAGPVSRPGGVIDDGTYRVSLDPKSGAVSVRKGGRELAGPGFAQYLYLKGGDPSKFAGLRDVRTRIVDNGPLVWTLRATGRGEGANGEIVREFRLVKGLGSVEVSISLDKAKVRDKEIAFFSMPFALQRPTVHFEGPWAPFDPATQLVEGANDQFFTVDRWIQMQSGSLGVTVVSPDTPVLVQGRPSAARLGDTQPYDPHSPNLQFQLAQNHWYTNYLAYQTGPIKARYFLRADSAYDSGASSRLAEDVVRPLVVGSASASLPFSVEGNVELSALRPARSGGWIVRVYGASGKPAAVRIVGRGITVYASDGRETKGARIAGPIALPAFGVKTFLVKR